MFKLPFFAFSIIWIASSFCVLESKPGWLGQEILATLATHTALNSSGTLALSPESKESLQLKTKII